MKFFKNSMEVSLGYTHSLILDGDHNKIASSGPGSGCKGRPGGKVAREQYRKIRESNERLNLLATIKLNSSCAVMGKDAMQEKEGSVYYIISSETALKLLKKQDN